MHTLQYNRAAFVRVVEKPDDDILDKIDSTFHCRIGEFLSCMQDNAVPAEKLCQQEFDLIGAGLQKQQINALRRFVATTTLQPVVVAFT